MLQHRISRRLRRNVLFLTNALRRLAVTVGYIPNHEWFRAQLNRAVTMDRAKAHIAIAECERALRLRRAGIAERCFGPLRR